MSDASATTRTPVQRAGLILGLLVFGVLLISPRWGWELTAQPKQPAVEPQPKTDAQPKAEPAQQAEAQPKTAPAQQPAPVEPSLLNSMAAIVALMAIWWITEALPIAVTSLLPLVLFPLLKIPPGSLVAKEYGDPLIFLFLGGFLIALAIEDSGLHRRVALHIISFVGDNPRGVVLGFMLAAGFLSMWLSNTATTIMLLPLATVVLQQVDERGMDPERSRRFGVALMLGLAYSASIGGMATIIGTPPNILFKSFYERSYPESTPISFASWMAVGFPLALTFLICTWWLLTRVLCRLDKTSCFGGKSAVREQLELLGPIRPAEWRMLAIFLTTALLWILREPTAGIGWGPLLGLGEKEAPKGTKWVDDGTVAILMAILCFIVPAGEKHGARLLDWSAAKRLPWGVLLLFGGGLAMGSGMKSSHLDEFIGAELAVGLAGLSSIAMIALTATATTFATEVTSNLACINMLLPVLGGVCKELSIDPRKIMIAATISSSCAFMLPVATAPNAIVYGSGRIRMRDMVLAGFWLNWLGVLLVVLFVGLLG